MKPLEGKIALVIGASRDIGRHHRMHTVEEA
jgi:hypothetical protein